jgi:hypothetical protein
MALHKRWHYYQTASSIRLQSPRYIAALAIFLRGVTFGGGVTTLRIKKSSTFFPIFIAADSHRGLNPRPAHVSLGFSGLRYFGATGALAPRREPDFELADPAWKRVSFDSSASNARRWSVTLAPNVSLTCSRRATSWSIDIDFKFMLLRSIHGGRLQDAARGAVLSASYTRFGIVPTTSLNAGQLILHAAL